MKELDTVVLRRGLPDLNLVEGDVGAVVHVHGPDAFEVEFVTGQGATVAVATLPAAALRPMSEGELLHVRDMARDQATG
tara:strand:+ start:235 stop:471 length:237 start_codon:yes stop_codon:yes gene_type:complete